MGKIINNIIITLSIMFLSFCWARYLTKINSISLCFSIAAALLYIALTVITSKNKSPQPNSLSDKLAVYLASNPNATSTIDKLLKYYNYSMNWVADNACIASRNSESMLVYCHLPLEDMTSVNAIEALKLARNNGINKLAIIANNCSPKCNIVLSNCSENYRLLTIPTLQQWLENAQLLPQLTAKSTSQSQISRYVFTRASAGGYAVSALFLLITSIFSYMPLYTLMWATLLVVLSLYSRFNKKHNLTQSTIMSI